MLFSSDLLGPAGAFSGASLTGPVRGGARGRALLGIAVLALGLIPGVRAGSLTERYELTLERVLKGGSPEFTHAFLLADVIPDNQRRFTNFSGDLSGRYIGALGTIASWRGTRFPSADRLVRAVLRNQRSDGHFGKEMGRREILSDDMARLWGNGRLLIGLLEHEGGRDRPEVLRAARRLGDFLVRVARRYNHPNVQRQFQRGKLAIGYICWTQNIEGLVALYRRTSDERYRRLAEELAERTSRHPEQHSHGYLSSLRGIVELSRATGDKRHLVRVEDEVEALTSSDNFLIQGAIPEYFEPGVARDEGCSQADWLRLNLLLWEETGRAKYLEHAELTLFNAFFMNQFGSGDFGHLQITGEGMGPNAEPAWWCCTLHGLRAFPEIFRAVFHAEGSSLFYDLPADGEAELDGIAFSAESFLETRGSVRLSVQQADGRLHTLSVRVPKWARTVTLSATNPYMTQKAYGEAGDAQAVQYLTMSRRWKKGEELRIQYELRARTIKDEQHETQQAIRLGPWILAATEGALDESGEDLDDVVLPEEMMDGRELLLAPARDASGPGGKFSAPIAHRRLELAGGAMDLRPLAERTGFGSDEEWRFWFATERPSAALEEAKSPRMKIVIVLVSGLLVLALTGWLFLKRFSPA